MIVDALLEAGADRAPDKTALVCGSQRRSYGELDAQANRLAHALIGGGIHPGDRVVVCLPNSIDAVVSMFAILKAGGVFVVVHPHVRSAHLAAVLADSGASAVMTGGRRSGAIRTFTTCDAPDQPHRCPRKRHTDADVAALVYTSGSTGVPKGVMLTHRNLLAAASAITSYLDNNSDDVILTVLPLAFTYGLGQVTTAFLAGATVVLEPSSAYPHAIVQTLVRERVTGLPLVPTLATLLLQQQLADTPLPHLRYITSAAAALPVSRIQRLREAFPSAKLYSMYGQTECQRVSYLPPQQLDVRPTSVGVPIPGTFAWVADELGNTVSAGTMGELVVRGPHVMKGYWNQPEQTARVLRWPPGAGEPTLRTGDLFRADRDGFLYFVDRQDDIIKTRGEKVAPRVVEEVIASLPGVAEVSVYGVPDDLLGEAVAASIAPTPGAQLTRAQIQRHCLEHLEPLMVPRRIDLRDALPTTPNGKVSRGALRAEGSRMGEGASR